MTSSNVFCREVYYTMSLFWRVHYRRFHCKRINYCTVHMQKNPDNEFSRANITCLVYSHDGKGMSFSLSLSVSFFFPLFSSLSLLFSSSSLSWPPLSLLIPCILCHFIEYLHSLLFFGLQSCCVATTMRTFIYLTPATAAGVNSSRSTKVIATVQQVQLTMMKIVQ